eukprot:m.195671 g.195671  ORF g.195671 m.195671 type:complete len:92 (+) comp18682_c0_seq2:1066-1341(+)
MLAVWLRTKYAHLVTGAWGASAPIAGLDNTRIDRLYDITAADFPCAPRIRNAFLAILHAVHNGDVVRVEKSLGLCQPFNTSQRRLFQRPCG